MRHPPSPADQTPLLFAYGTLKRGLENHCVIEQAGGEFLGEAQTEVAYPLVADGLPYLLDRRRTGRIVHGEVFRVMEAPGWDLLDRLEDHPEFYRRRIEPVVIEGGGRVQAWIYFFVQEIPRLAGLPHLERYP
jgi:gamma-glutamylcyclotransferase (GGCT)/AIG2-like uncharacterized protein YtfP